MNSDETRLGVVLSDKSWKTVLSDLKRNVVDIDGFPFTLKEHVWVQRVHTYDEFIVVGVESNLVGLSDLHSPILLDPRTVMRTSPHATFHTPGLVPPGRMVWVKSFANRSAIFELDKSFANRLDVNEFSYVCGRMTIRTGKFWFQPLDFQKAFDEARWVSKFDTISVSPVQLSQIEDGLHWTVDVVREIVMVVSTTSDGPIEFFGSFDDFLLSPFTKRLSECAAVVAFY